MLDGILWIVTNIGYAFVNIFNALTQPSLWLSWLPYINQTIPEAEQKQALMRFVYYGGSVELFFALTVSVLILTVVGLLHNRFMWGCVQLLEGFANTVGRLFAWAGLLMVLQQVVIIFIQRIFAQAQISMGLGMSFSKDISWWAEELKFYNALVVCLCCTYTFVQGGHVRVDLIYSAVSYRTKRIIDMCGALLFMIPAAVLTWMYSWYFLWRHLITPKPSASDTLDRLLAKSRAVRWNIETIGFSPNGFNAYFLFKILLIALTAMIFLQAIAFFYRSYLEYKEGPDAEGKYLDKDKLGDEEAELAADIH
ncbi:MAG: TRAP transporter small permease subunit [Pseudomonadota bacterium]